MAPIRYIVVVVFRRHYTTAVSWRMICRLSKQWRGCTVLIFLVVQNCCCGQQGYRPKTETQRYMREARGGVWGPVGVSDEPGPHTSTQRQSPTEINHAVIWFRPALDTGRRLADGRRWTRAHRSYHVPCLPASCCRHPRALLLRQTL